MPHFVPQFATYMPQFEAKLSFQSESTPSTRQIWTDIKPCAIIFPFNNNSLFGWRYKISLSGANFALDPAA
jgi:hypothetical protein